MKTVVGINTLESVNSYVYSNHIELFCKMKEEYPQDTFTLVTPHRLPIDKMRNLCAKLALEQNYDYLMFIDDDVLVMPNTYKSLRDADKDIVMALTFVRGWPYPPMFFKSEGIVTDRDGYRRENLSHYIEWADHVNEEGLVECAALGFSCVLIKVDVLRAVSPPYFITSESQTEDVYFCCKARLTLDPAPTIFVDTKVPTEHMLSPDTVTLKNVEELRELHTPADEKKKIGSSRYKRITDTVRELSLVK